MYSEDEMKTKEVTEGDSATQHTGIAKPQRYDQILWRFGPQGSLITRIPLRNKETLPEDDERLTIDLLYVDSLRFSEGEDVTLDTGVSELQRDDQILWSFKSEDTIIAKRDGDTNQVLNDGGRFRDRLQMDDQTGSLTITNTKTTDSGVYHLQISSRNKVSYQKFSVCLDTVKVRAGGSVTLNTDVTEPEDDNDTSLAEISQVSSKTSVNHDEENKVSVMEGDRAKLNTDVSELQRDALILWMFGSRDGLIAKADMENNRISIYDGADGRYRDRLELDRQTGSLSITNTTCTDSGLYKLKIISSTETKSKLFRVTVSVNRETNREDAGESFLRENSEKIPLFRTYSGTSV
uniref:Immunoglobulin domain-containing protein n=1 Tax=Cyprinus carpio TaxID=7962 RepID=A0A8C1ZPK6_CYPCA